MVVVHWTASEVLGWADEIHLSPTTIALFREKQFTGRDTGKRTAPAPRMQASRISRHRHLPRQFPVPGPCLLSCAFTNRVPRLGYIRVGCVRWQRPVC